MRENIVQMNSLERSLEDHRVRVEKLITVYGLEHNLGQGGFSLPIRGKERGVNPPFIFGPALGGDATDDDLALAQREMALIEQAAAAEPFEQARIAGQRREQDEWRNARRHDAIQDACRSDA